MRVFNFGRVFWICRSWRNLPHHQNVRGRYLFQTDGDSAIGYCASKQDSIRLVRLYRRMRPFEAEHAFQHGVHEEPKNRNERFEHRRPKMQGKQLQQNQA